MMKIEIGQYLGQDGVWLKNDQTRLFVQKFGGMTPEFSSLCQLGSSAQWVNTHWNPHFKTPFSGKLNPASQEQQTYWGIELMRQAAGTFPCAPNFGPGNSELLPHGDTANMDWQLEDAQQTKSRQQEAVYAHWKLTGNYQGLHYRKWDILPASSSTHYMVLEVINPTDKDVEINLAWHTTLGAPFLERGCLIETNCSQFKTAPTGTEFDHTSALKSGAEFTSLGEAPVSQSHSNHRKTKDVSTMPGYNGLSEFISGVTDHSRYLWSVCINPYLKMAYLTLVPFDAIERQANASSMNYWIHSGGRDFTPWADYQGGVDRNYALGMETSIGASCLGLDWARKHPEYLGKPTHCTLAAGASLRFPCINTIFEVDLTTSTDEQQQRQSIHQLVERYISTLDTRFSVFTTLTQKDD